MVGGLTVGTTGFATIENSKEMGFSQLIEAMAFVTQVPCGNNESQNASIECREEGLNQIYIIS